VGTFTIGAPLDSRRGRCGCSRPQSTSRPTARAAQRHCQHVVFVAPPGVGPDSVSLDVHDDRAQVAAGSRFKPDAATARAL
jgi:hypothetical protein